MSFRGYQGLSVWNRTVDLVELIYRLSETLHEEAPVEVLAELRRGALALPSHLAAGYQTSETLEYLRHVHAAQLILSRLETNITILERLDWADDVDVREIHSLLTHLDQLLVCLERYLTGEKSHLEVG